MNELENELSSCPLCNGDVYYVVISNVIEDDTWYVSCLSCGCCTGNKNTKQECIDVWNTRPLEEELLMKNVMLEITLIDLTDFMRVECDASWYPGPRFREMFPELTEKLEAD